MTTPNESEKVPSTPVVEPFPKPNTIPSGWDVSAFKADEQTASEGKPLKQKPENRKLDLK